MRLAKANATVLVGCRDVSKCREFRAYHLDLEDLQQVARVAHELKQLPRLDILATWLQLREVDSLYLGGLCEFMGCLE